MASVIQVLREMLPGRSVRAVSIRANVSADRRRLMRSKSRTVAGLAGVVMAPLWRHIVTVSRWFFICSVVLDKPYSSLGSDSPVRPSSSEW
jgi:hypothetical protein